MPKGTVTRNDVEQAWWFSGTALFGDMLKDTASLEERTAIYKKISTIRALYNQTDVAPQLLADYPDLLRKVQEDEEQLGEAISLMGVSGEKLRAVDYVVFKSPECDKVIELHKEGLKELSRLLEKRLAQGNFKSLSEQNHCYMMKSYIDDFAAGRSFSRDKLSDEQYQFSHAVTAKFRTSGSAFTVSDEGEFQVLPRYANDAEVFEKIDSTGIIHSTAGGKRIFDLTRNHLETGDTARGELYEEYKQQRNRIANHFRFSEEDYNKLIKDNPNLILFDNAYSELSGQRGRGFNWAMIDIDAKIEAMKNGWPVSDLNALGTYAVLLDNLDENIQSSKTLVEKNKSSIEAEKAKEKPNQKKIEDWQKENNKFNERIERLSTAYDKMKDAWEEANGGLVNEEKRKEKLQVLKNALDDVKSNELKDYDKTLDRTKYMIDERVSAKLAEHEKALLTETATEMLAMLNDVDPTLVKSSDAFKKFKEELKKLAELDDSAEKSGSDKWFQEQAEKVMKAGAAYLQYKTKQLHKDPSRKRSDLEAKRVKVVDAIIGKLTIGKVPGTGHAIYGDDFNPIHTRGHEPDVIFDEFIDTSAKNYDTYIKLHTGRAAENGTREEMIEDLAKVTAAWALKKQFGEPFSKKEIDKQAKNIRLLYNLDAVSTEDLRNALRTPKTADSFIKERQKDLSEVKDFDLKNEKGETRYSIWWNNMSALYRIMKDPGRVNSEAYTKLFETVKEAAHMPRPGVVPKMKKDLLENKVAQLNFKMMQYANMAVDEKGFSEKKLNHDSLHVLHTLRGFTSGAENIINNIDERVDKKRYDKDPESLKFVSYGFYGAKMLYEGRKEINNGNELRTPDDDKILENEKKYRKSANTITLGKLNVNKAFNGKYKEAIKINGKLPRNTKAPKGPKEEPAPKVNRPHL